MIFTAALTLAILPAYVSAQAYGAPPNNPAPATTTSAAAVSVPSAPADTPGHMNIDVGFQGGFTFHPSNISAPNGTLVTFWIPNPGYDHSVTQSSFAAPCTYLAATSNTSAGFDSGLVNSATFTINITDDTQPIWFHCKQIDHCGMGMVGSINAPASGSNTFDAFQAAAVAIGTNEVTETDSGAVTGGVNALATAAPTNDVTTATGGSSGSSSDGIKVASNTGIILMVAAVIAALV